LAHSGDEPIVQSNVSGSDRFLINGGVDSFVFSNPSPTPDPTTLLLFGTEIAFAVARRVRRS